MRRSFFACKRLSEKKILIKIYSVTIQQYQLLMPVRTGFGGAWTIA